MNQHNRHDIENKIRDILHKVPYPQGGSLVDAGIIEGVSVAEGNAVIVLRADTRFGAQVETIRLKAEQALRQAGIFESVTVVLTAQRDGAAKSLPKPMPSIPGIHNIIAVASGKGGVGKSTVTANLAIALRDAGLRVGILDADIYGPSMPRMFGVSGKKPEGEQKRIIPIEAHGIKIMSIGFMIDEARPLIWRGPMVQSALRQFLEDTLWGELDVLLVDFPPGTGDVQLTMAQKVPMTGAVIVSTPQDIALIDARKGMAMFTEMAVPILGVIENMSHFICPHCQGESHIFGHGGAKEEAVKNNLPFLGGIALLAEVRLQADEGRPYCDMHRESAIGQQFAEIAKEVSHHLQKIDAA
jgi:ATP-binding protein involved in chromosome partitioning